MRRAGFLMAAACLAAVAASPQALLGLLPLLALLVALGFGAYPGEEALIAWIAAPRRRRRRPAPVRWPAHRAPHRRLAPMAAGLACRPPPVATLRPRHHIHV